jgi:hypothetical protein
MFRRLIVGLVLGMVVGALAAAVIIKGLGILTFASAGGVLLAYFSAIVTGALVGLVAGKPVWAKGAWIEVALKAFFGSLLAAGLMFALRSWVQVSLDLTSLGASVGPMLLGQLPAAALPIIATLLSVFYELDNTDTPEPEASGKKAAGGSVTTRVAATKAGNPSARVETSELDGEEEAQSSKKMKK